MKPEAFLVMVCLLLGACSSSSGPGPEPVLQDSVIVTINIPYTSEMMLDVRAPGEAGSFPVVVAFHGGESSKANLSLLSHQIVEKAIVVFSPSWHSVAPTSKEVFLKGWEDAACAVRFARQHAAEYKGDPSRIIVVGYSAGGAVGATITLAGDDFSGDCLVGAGSALPNGFVGLEGAYQILTHLSPTVLADTPEDTVNLINPFDALERQAVREDVEFILFAGDEAEFYVESDAFLSALRSKGYSAELTKFTDYNHSDFTHDPHTQIIEAIASLAKKR